MNTNKKCRDIDKQCLQDMLDRLLSPSEPTEEELRSYALNRLGLDDRDRIMKLLATSEQTRSKLEQVQLELAEEASRQRLSEQATLKKIAEENREVGVGVKDIHEKGPLIAWLRGSQSIVARLIRQELKPVVRIAAVFLLAFLLMRLSPPGSNAAKLGAFLLFGNSSFDSTSTFPEQTKYLPPVQEEINGSTFIVPANDAHTPTEDEMGNRLYIFDDEPHDFMPVGWMPDGQGIAQRAIETDTPHKGKHCIRVDCQLSDKPYVGVYFLLDGNWEPRRVFNLHKLLGVNEQDSIKCRFWARTKMEEDKVYIQCKVGGVHKGEIHDSLLFPISSPWIGLTHEWRMYEIDVTGQDLSSMVSGFAWVCDRAHNGQRDVSFDLDTIYFVRTVK